MFEQGARNFVFSDRSGIDRPAANGARVSVIRGDISHAIEQVQNPIEDVIHAAMILKVNTFL